MSVKGLGIAGKDDCYRCLSSVKSELEAGQLNKGLIDALEGFRATYLENILKPAVKQHIHNDALNSQALKKLYTNALKIENLLEVIHFMNKVHDIE
ncbi:MAG: hypothetical protein IH631_01260 [Candidatus Thorarchaeota archaeon]|nr:hypothetical protein [Candidatus Thorarchaeota archaeon]